MPLLLGSAPNQISVNSDLGTAAFIDAKQLPVSTAQALADAAVLSAAALDATTKANAASTPPGGATNQVQYNNAGAFAGSANLTFNGTILTAVRDAVVNGLTIGKGAGGGSTNTVIGSSALANTTTGNSNTAIGYIALNNNTTGGSNTAIGSGALSSNTTAIGNTAIGSSALTNTTTGGGNTSINVCNASGSVSPVFNPTTENNRFCMGSTSVTNAYIQVAWTVVSDARDKTDFAPVPHGLDFVRQLKPTAYRYTMNRGDTEGHGPVRYGFKAQEVLALEGETPVIVDAEDADKLRFNDQSMIAVLVNAIQELNAKFDAYVVSHP
jgi:hypothetical protein